MCILEKEEFGMSVLRKKNLLRQQMCGTEILRQEGGEVQTFHTEEMDLWI